MKSSSRDNHYNPRLDSDATAAGTAARNQHILAIYDSGMQESTHLLPKLAPVVNFFPCLSRFLGYLFCFCGFVYLNVCRS